MTLKCRPVDEELAALLREFRSPSDNETRMFYEVVIAPGYTPEGLAKLKGKSKTLRILEAKPRAPEGQSLRQVAGGTPLHRLFPSLSPAVSFCYGFLLSLPSPLLLPFPCPRSPLLTSCLFNARPPYCCNDLPPFIAQLSTASATHGMRSPYVALRDNCLQHLRAVLLSTQWTCLLGMQCRLLLRRFL